MSQRTMGWYSIEADQGKCKPEVNQKEKKTKKKPPDLNLLQQSEILERRRHSFHNQDSFSPPYYLSPKGTSNRSHFPALTSPSPLLDSPLSKSPPRDQGAVDMFVTPRIHSREKSMTNLSVDTPPDSPSAIITPRSNLNKVTSWYQQPRRRSLTPIPEKRDTNSPRRTTPPDFVKEIITEDYVLDDIRVIVGSNKIRVIGERKVMGDNTRYNENCSEIAGHGLYKVIDIPKNIDPTSIKVKKCSGKVTIHGYEHQEEQQQRPLLKQRRNSSSPLGFNSNKSDVMTVNIKIPPGVDSKKLRFKTETKHYLVVSGSVNEVIIDEEISNEDEDEGISSMTSGEDFCQTIELPREPDIDSITYQLRDGNNLNVDIPFSFRSRASSM